MPFGKPKLALGFSSSMANQGDNDSEAGNSAREETKKQSKQKFSRRKSTLISQADVKKSMSIKWQSLLDGDESSDFSVDE